MNRAINLADCGVRPMDVPLCSRFFNDTRNSRYYVSSANDFSRDYKFYIYIYIYLLPIGSTREISGDTKDTCIENDYVARE